jgi:hypothetical protein
LNKITSFFCGVVRFSVWDIEIGFLNKLKKFKLFAVATNAGGADGVAYISFSTALINENQIRRILGKRKFTANRNVSALSVVNFFYARSVLIMAVAVALGAFFITERYAFRTEIGGVEGEQKVQIANYLSARGFGGITPKRLAHDKNLLNTLVSDFNFVSGAYMTLDGSRMRVNVICAENVVSQIPAADIVATAAGYIADIIVFSGTAKVVRGDVVRVGDVLVTGTRPTAIIKIADGTDIVCMFNNTVLDLG